LTANPVDLTADGIKKTVEEADLYAKYAKKASTAKLR